jgi:hypothetical protein
MDVFRQPPSVVSLRWLYNTRPGVKSFLKLCYQGSKAPAFSRVNMRPQAPVCVKFKDLPLGTLHVPCLAHTNSSTAAALCGPLEEIVGFFTRRL